MNWILLSPPPLSSDPDNPPKIGTYTWEKALVFGGFSVSLGIAEILGFSGLSVCAGLSYSRSFHGTLGCASAAGIGGVVGFCGLGDKTFETDFNSWIFK